MFACKVVSVFLCISLATAYFVVHAILANILGHAIFVIAQPEIYLASMPATVSVAIFGSLTLVGATFPLILLWWVLGIVLAEGEFNIFFLFATVSKVLELFLPVPMGVILNVLGVVILRKHGFQGPLLDLARAAAVGAVGQVVIIGVHFWRFK
ncbi:hypothetical protein C8J57DRAFT_1212213 [Mycena rebaudengoi]|nr:hypothetical protein C8J57DRAFT_1212213 [Mycena rebaudengoi]